MLSSGKATHISYLCLAFHAFLVQLHTSLTDSVLKNTEVLT